MPSYTAGTLELSVLGISTSAITSITSTVKALNSLSRAIAKINNAQVLSASNTMAMFFTKMADATKNIDTSALSTLSSSAKSVSAIARLGKLQDLDYGKIAAGFNQLTAAITPFLTRVKDAENSLVSLNGILSKGSTKSTQNILNPSTKGKGSFSLLNLTKWTAVIYTARRLGRVVANIAQSGADYTETLNLWQTAMGNNLTVATEFVNKMNQAYGISEKTLMNAQAIFKNMLGSLGQISDTMAYSLSEGITQMALDYASLYNVTFEQAFTKFQAALAGQVRPIRSVAGYDITENTIFQLYQALGGTKTMRQLSRTEKQLLSILAIFKQMSASGAVGDLNKTMESFANQSRVSAEAWHQILAYSGVIFTHMIETSGVMVYVNAALLFLGDTLKAVAEDMNAIKSFGDPFQSVTDGAELAQDEIDNVSGKLLDFDKFRSLSGQEESPLGLDEKLLEAFSQFDSILESSSMEARELAEQFKLASGLFDKSGAFNPEVWDDYIESIKHVGETILTVFAGVATIKAVTGLIGIVGQAKGAIEGVGKAFEVVDAIDHGVSFKRVGDVVGGASTGILSFGKALSFLKSPIGIVLGLLATLYLTNDEVRESINELFKSLTPLIKFVGSQVITLLTSLTDDALSPIMGILGDIVVVLAKYITWSLDKALLAITPVMYAIETIVKLIESSFEIFKDLLTLDFSNFKSQMSDIWSNWSSNDYAKSTWDNTVSAFNNLKGGVNVSDSGVVSDIETYSQPTVEIPAYSDLSSNGNVYTNMESALNSWWRYAREDIPHFEEASDTGLYKVVTSVAKSYGQKWDTY